MGCGCSDSLTQAQILNLIADQLPSVSDGQYGGYASKWVFSSTTTASPASTEIRLNSATYNSVTTIYINETNADSTNVANLLNSFNNGGSYGYIRIFKEFDSSVFWLGEVTAVTDSGSYYTLTVTYTLHSGSFTTADNLVVQFVGNGANGPNGTDGVAVVYSDVSDTVVNDTSFALQKQYDWADDVILDTDGDELRVEIGYEITSAGSKSLGVYFGDWSGGGVQILDIQYGDALLATPNKQGKIVIKIKRINSTTAKIWIDLQQFLTTNALTDNFNSVDDHQSGYFTRSITFANFSQIDLVSRVSGGTPLTINELTVYKYEA